jgi:hemerythrin-like domain-containing protein
MDTLFARLEHEHRTILDALDAFERFLTLARTTSLADPSDLPRFLLFFREYVDRLHLEREERVLLPALARHDFSTTRGPLAHVRESHDRERELLHALMTLGFRQGGCPASDPELARRAEAFIDFERRHLEQEDDRLYPAAREALRNEHARMQSELARFDAQGDGVDRIAWLERMLGELLSSYGPSAERRRSA